MKGINPFTPGIQKPEETASRKQEANLFESYLASTIAGQPVFIDLVGAKGMGKTLLLRKFQAIANRNKALAILFRAQKSDRLQRLIFEIQNALAEKVSLNLLTEKHSENLKNIKTNISDEITNENPEKIFEEIYNVLKKEFGAVVFLVDDTDNFTKELLNRILNLFSKLAEKKLSYMVVLSSNGYLHELHEKRELFRPMQVSQLNEHEMREFIEKALQQNNQENNQQPKIKMGEECLHAIMDDSQGHPLVLLTTCWTIYDRISDKEKIITKGHYTAYLPTIMNSLARELFDDLYEETSPNERNVLKAIAKLGNEAAVSEISKTINKPLNTITTLVLRLAESGNLTKIARGRYKIFNRLYGKYVLSR